MVLGMFIEYDTHPNSSRMGFMHIKVVVDVRKLIFRQKKFILRDGNSINVMFKYKCLSVFCYLCSPLGHSESFLQVTSSSSSGNHEMGMR